MTSGTLSARYFSEASKIVMPAAVGQMAGEAAFGAGGELVFEADVGEGAADHDFVVAAAGAVGVEVGGLNAMGDEIFAGGAVLLDRAGRRDVIGRDAVAEQGEDAGAVDVLRRRPGLAGMFSK